MKRQWQIIIGGYRQILEGAAGVLVALPAIFGIIVVATLIVKYAVKLVLWIW